jgi:hypothetical protein
MTINLLKEMKDIYLSRKFYKSTKKIILLKNNHQKQENLKNNGKSRWKKSSQMKLNNRSFYFEKIAEKIY